ncbi:MAG: hypothetical protein ACE5HT_13640 [Gemmatimonadales bacterium]
MNLLGGRARTKYLHPLTWPELGAHFDLARAIERGTLPSIYFSDEPAADLEAYGGTYLQFTNVANDAQVPRTTVYEYFEIFKDTLVLREFPAWRKSIKRKRAPWSRRCRPWLAGRI